MDKISSSNGQKSTVTESADKPEAPTRSGNSIIFHVSDLSESLAAKLQECKKQNMNVLHIESRPSKAGSNGFDIIVVCDRGLSDCEQIITDLGCQIVPQQDVSNGPWIPKKIWDLDVTAARVLNAGEELEADHPGFTDQVYRARRKVFADIANSYKHGQPIPIVEYTKDEIQTWTTIFKELTKLYPTHACKEFNQVFPMLVEKCGYREDNIPQLQDISDFLKERSGFQLRPVAGLLSSRDFLAGLAFRVFHSTQYIRHGSKPMYTPEPDVCHELLGHVPLLADPTFAQFSQEIGLASLGAPDEYITQLATLYWFTVEFGMCRQDDKRKAYGAGLLSSFGELKYCLTDKPEIRSFEPAKAAVQEYPITCFQPIYYLADSFEDAKEKLRAFAATIPRPFGLRYDPYTQSVQVLNGKDHLISCMREIKGEIDLLGNAVQNMSHFSVTVQ